MRAPKETRGDGLARRMRESYEAPHRSVLPRRVYTVLRMDGSNFRSYTSGLDKPFDHGFAHDMARTAQGLCQAVPTAKLAYVASDEISLLLCDFDSTATQPWLGGVVPKMLSTAAGMTTALFGAARVAREQAGGDVALPWFDARLATFADPVEVANNFIWRQRDTRRNSVSMAAHAHFDHSSLQGLSNDQCQDRLRSERGLDWNDYPVWAKRGSLVVRGGSLPPVQQSHPGDARMSWKVVDAPHLDTEPGGFLDSRIPRMGY